MFLIITFCYYGLISVAALILSLIKRLHIHKSLAEFKTDEHFLRLMKLLAGNPLAMSVILANLKNKSPQEIFVDLEHAENFDFDNEYIVEIEELKKKC